MKKWTYSDIPSLHEKVAIVTGANSGLGYYTTKGLAQNGCEVIMACRNLEKAESAKAELLTLIPDAKLTLMKLDLASLQSVRSFAKEVIDKFSKIDLLVNNAGLMAIPYKLTEDGFEMQFGVNHLGHFALTGLLFGMLKDNQGARIINVSSAAHNLGEIHFDDINWEKNYKKWRAYGMSKLANIHFTYELADRICKRNYKTLVIAAHPGYADTKLMEKGPEMTGRRGMIKAGRIANSIVAQSSEMGALPSLYAATSEEAVQRGFYGPGGFFGMRGYPVLTHPNKKKLSKTVQEKLWDLSEELTGVVFKFD